MELPECAQNVVLRTRVATIGRKHSWRPQLRFTQNADIYEVILHAINLDYLQYITNLAEN